MTDLLGLALFGFIAYCLGGFSISGGGAFGAIASVRRAAAQQRFNEARAKAYAEKARGLR